MNDKVNHQISQDNQWYTSKQLESLANPAARRIYAQRWDYFHTVFQGLKVQKKPIRILDAGCGDGINLKYLDSLDNTVLTAFDYNPLRVQRVKEEFPNVSAHQVDLTDITVDSGPFDLILLSQVLEHIENDLKALQQLKQLLAPNGRFIVGVPNEGCLLARLRNHVLEPNIAKTTDHVNFYTEGVITNLMKQAGFEVESIMREGFFYPLQRVNGFFMQSHAKFLFTQKLGRLFPWLCAGYYFSIKHSSAAAPEKQLTG